MHCGQMTSCVSDGHVTGPALLSDDRHSDTVPPPPVGWPTTSPTSPSVCSDYHRRGWLTSFYSRVSDAVRHGTIPQTLPVRRNGSPSETTRPGTATKPGKKRSQMQNITAQCNHGRPLSRP
ncbi:hypothetical protein DPEC_G00268230 [Dallia pectoralis]|uniref:Uncharacterized protein n=1 Tax=Dallia pectoralis TaxID=75939 RepID=A0ACC2FP31_DALPE|nr:hypothetical protein DPEC_G00268230 [Dallia pectoralis]